MASSLANERVHLKQSLACTQARTENRMEARQINLSQSINGFLSQPGKRIRASLLTLGFRLAGGQGQIPQLLLDFIELLHAGSLVIDDIEDDSDIRRGQVALHRQLGLPIALNTGNWMYFLALEKLTRLKGPTHKLLSIQSLAIRSIRRCHEGQAIDLEARVDLLSPLEIQVAARRITRLKTSELTGLATRLGAYWATSDYQKLRAVRSFGVRLGTALQMQNDYQELYRCAVGVGLSDDLANRRVTWPWAWAAASTSSARLKELQRSLNHELTSQHCVASKVLLEVENKAVMAIEEAKQRALAAIESYTDRESLTILSSIFRKLQC
jgi:geranylgeranyl pyrophosphate synthase